MKTNTVFALIAVLLLYGSFALGQEDIKTLLPKANAGDPAAQVQVGRMYLLGTGHAQRQAQRSAEMVHKGCRTG